MTFAEMKIAAYLFLACILGATSANIEAAGIRIATVSPTRITATLQPDATEIGMTANVWMGAVYQDRWYLRNAQTWVSYAWGALPIAIHGQTLSLSTTVTVAENLDISSYVGLAIYVGYGSSEQEMLTSPGKLAKIYTVAETAGTPSNGSPPLLTLGVIEKHAANTEIMWNWLSYVPPSIPKVEPSYILICDVQGNLMTDDYDAMTSESLAMLGFHCKSFADRYGYIALVPVIPRNQTNYPAAFFRKSLLPSTDNFYRRANEKVNLMIDELQRVLRLNGYNVQQKVFLEGFSTGGSFTQIYTLLHPERVRAAAAGHAGGSLVLPLPSLNGTILQWEVGVSDFRELLDFNFDNATYMQVPQFVFIGELDNGPPHTQVYYPVESGGMYTSLQLAFLNNTFGSTDPERLWNQCAYLRQLGYDITFKSYPGVGHQQSRPMDDDVFAFFQSYR